MKRIYESPELQQIDLLSESLLITASPGVGGDYDPMKNSIKKDHWKLVATLL